MLAAEQPKMLKFFSGYQLRAQFDLNCVSSLFYENNDFYDAVYTLNTAAREKETYLKWLKLYFLKAE